MKEILIYTENSHDDYFISFLRCLDFLNDDISFIKIIIDSRKKKRIQEELNSLKLNINSKVTYHQNAYFKLNITILRRPLNIILRFINFLRLLFFKIPENSHVFLLESYDKENLWGLRLNKKNGINLTYTLHDIEEYDQKLYSSAKNFMVLGEIYKQKLSFLTSKTIIVIPYSFPSLTTLEARRIELSKLDFNKIKIVVTGYISNKRKDYVKLIRYVSKINRKAQLIELIFLGKLIDKDIITFAHELDVFPIYYKDFVNNEEFKKQILKSHFLLGLHHDDSKYYNGKAASGILYDAMKFGVPLITNNKNLYHDGVLTILYENSFYQNFQNLIVNLDRDKYLNGYARKSLEISSKIDPNNYFNSLKELS